MLQLTIKEAIMSLVLRHPDWSTNRIQIELVALGFDRPTSLLVSNIKLGFKANLKFLIKAGVIDADARPSGPRRPDLIHKPTKKKRRRPDPPDLPYHHYYGGKDD